MIGGRARIMENEVTIVDSHCHIGDLKGIWGHKKHSASSQIELMDECKIDKAVVFSFSSGLLAHEDFVLANNRVAEAVSQFPARLIGFAVVNPMFENRAIEEMQRAHRDLSMRGLKLHPVLHGGYPIDSGFVFLIVEQAIEFDWPVLIHTDLNNQAATPYRLMRLAKRYPEVRVVAAHMGIDPAFMDACLVEAEELPNVFMDTSCTPDSPTMIKRAVDILGPERVLFGSDAPSLSVKLALQKVRLANLQASEETKVLGGNILRIAGY